VDDFLYICDDAYKREELIAMEMSILSTLKFDINIPIPYRFLRRFAKVSAAGGWAGVKVHPGSPRVGSWVVMSIPWALGSQLAASRVWPGPPTGLRGEDAGLWQSGGVGSVSRAPGAAL